MTNLSKVFENHKAFIPFIVADDPDADTTVKNVVALAEGGADIVELGIPFSDPVADGPVIQDADLRAFAAGVDTAIIFDIVAKVREQTQVPLVFLTYLNIVFKYGYDAFCKKCAELGVSGLVIPDSPYENKGELLPYAQKYDVDLIPLIAPTSGKRVEKIAKGATGFIYVVSSLGVTGKRETFNAHLQELVNQIRQYTSVPTAIGFGIHNAAQAKEMAEIADGSIIGSEIVDLVAKYGTAAPKHLQQFTQEVRQSLDTLNVDKVFK